MNNHEFCMSEQELEELEIEMIQENIESGYYRVVRSKKRFKKLCKRENVEIFFHKPINAWLWATIELHDDYDDGSEHVECRGSGSGLYDNTYGSEGVCWG